MTRQLAPYALQLAQPLGFWTSACRCIVMRRYGRAYSTGASHDHAQA